MGRHSPWIPALQVLQQMCPVVERVPGRHIRQVLHNHDCVDKFVAMHWIYDNMRAWTLPRGQSEWLVFGHHGPNSPHGHACFREEVSELRVLLHVFRSRRSSVRCHADAPQRWCQLSMHLLPSPGPDTYSLISDCDITYSDSPLAIRSNDKVHIGRCTILERHGRLQKVVIDRAMPDLELNTKLLGYTV